MKQLTKSLSRCMFSTLKMPACSFLPPKYTGPSFEEVLSGRQKHVSPAISYFFKNPLYIVQGDMQYLWDEKGKRYLDLHGGVLTVSVGHNHPLVKERVIKQMEKYIHTTHVYLNEEIVQYAKDLTAKLPKDYECVFFVNSGSEANDMAVNLARLYSGNQNMIAVQNCFHGLVGFSFDLTSMESWKANRLNSMGFDKALFPDMYRGVYSHLGESEQGEKYAEQVEKLIEYNTNGAVAGFIAEPVQGAGGVVPLPKPYLNKVQHIVRKAGGVLISDEVQTGFGRLGSTYWGFQDHDYKPDIITMAKGIGNGVPLGAVVCRKEIHASMAKKGFFNTYGGNPVSSAAGRAVLEIIEKEKCQENCKKMGAILEVELNKLKQKYEIVGNVRGKGLMQGIELVIDKQSKKPNTKAALNFVEKCKDYGLLTLRGGLRGNTIRVCPMLNIKYDDLKFALDVFDQALSDVQAGKVNYY